MLTKLLRCKTSTCYHLVQRDDSPHASQSSHKGCDNQHLTILCSDIQGGELEYSPDCLSLHTPHGFVQHPPRFQAGFGLRFWLQGGQSYG